jgi:hypothetical protein
MLCSRYRYQLLSASRTNTHSIILASYMYIMHVAACLITNINILHQPEELQLYSVQHTFHMFTHELTFYNIVEAIYKQVSFRQEMILWGASAAGGTLVVVEECKS